jgi:hypothetical protein
LLISKLSDCQWININNCYFNPINSSIRLVYVRKIIEYYKIVFFNKLLKEMQN